MVEPWVFHDEILSRNAFGWIEILMDDGFDPIILMGNSTKSGQAMHEMFLDSKESLFKVYLGSELVSINENEFRPHEIQSWLGLIKMLRSN
jgi:hypothetical protein